MKLLRNLLLLILPFVLSSSALAQGGTWKQITGFPGGGRYASVMFALGDTVYFGGGFAKKDFYSYLPSKGWKKLGDLPGVTISRGAASAFVIGGNAYIGMGQDRTAINTNLNDLCRYNSTTDKWTRMADCPGEGRDGQFAFVINDTAYIGGGVDISKAILTDFYSYDPKHDKWNSLTDLTSGPGGVFFPAPFAVGGYGYITTGSSISSEGTATWQYDPSNDSWITMANFPGEARQTAVSFVMNGKAYVGLGQAGYTTVYSNFFVYNAAKDEWDTAGFWPGANGLAWSSAVATSQGAIIGTGTDFQSAANGELWLLTPPGAGVATAYPLFNVATYPNPAHNKVRVDLPTAGAGYDIVLYNPIGARVKTATLDPSGFVDLSGLPSGIYDAVISSNSVRTTKRIVKE